MSKKISYKYCIVPCCVNTTIKTPEKIFFHVPLETSKRKAWIKAIKRDEKWSKELSATTALYCCEDHFSLPDDMENYWQWKLMNDVKRKNLKPDVIPHIFDCQKTRTNMVERSAAKKRKNMHLVQEAISGYNALDIPISTPSTSAAKSKCFESVCEIQSISETNDHHMDKYVQVNIQTPLRSKGTNTSIEMVSVACVTSNMGISVGTSTSPEKFQQSVESSDIESDSSDFAPQNESESSDNSSENETAEQSTYKEHMVMGTVLSIEKEPKLYLGLPKKCFFLINLLSQETKLPVNNIYLVLKKIKLNLQFSILAMDFGLTKSSACRIFAKSLPIIASSMQELIIMPQKNYVQARLPISFRARYGHVISLIDCLEIEIEKPSDPVLQALTWSTYYNCNTLKYLISCTPDGLITFISEGYGGRASDVLIVEKSGYLDTLFPGSSVMADRGFKNISNLLHQKNCNLVRPPSVSASMKSTKEEVKQSKRIAALRIHVERLIRRIREFKMLSPHASVDRQLTPIVDFCIVIVCGLINLQEKLIKQ